MNNPKRSAENRKNRQKVLDYLHANPGSTCHEIAKALGGTPRQLAARLTQMGKNNEVVGVSEGSRIPPKYSALVKRTARNYPPVTDNGALTRWDKVVDEQPKPAGTMSNRCDDSKRPIPNQGGQGGLKTKRTGVALAMRG